MSNVYSNIMSCLRESGNISLCNWQYQFMQKHCKIQYSSITNCQQYTDQYKSMWRKWLNIKFLWSQVFSTTQVYISMNTGNVEWTKSFNFEIAAIQLKHTFSWPRVWCFHLYYYLAPPNVTVTPGPPRVNPTHLCRGWCSRPGGSGSQGRYCWGERRTCGSRVHSYCWGGARQVGGGRYPSAGVPRVCGNTSRVIKNTPLAQPAQGWVTNCSNCHRLSKPI